jgi:lysophospholipase L1-like esterase
VTSQTIARIVDEGVLGGHNAKIAVVKIGTNDLGNVGTPVETVAANIRIILDAILERQAHVRILLLGILPRSKKNVDPFAILTRN